MRTIDEVIKDCEIIARNKKATAEEHKQFMRWLCKMAEKESGIEGMIKKIKQLFCRHRWRAVEIHRWRAVGISKKTYFVCTKCQKVKRNRREI